MASYNPPSENLPIFDNEVFVLANSTTLTKTEANQLYLRKTIADTCTALETFSAGLEASFINVSGTLTAATIQAFSNLITPLITTSDYEVTDPTLDCDFCNNQTSGVLNIGTNARTGNINIGTNQTNNQLSIGSTFNTQTNITGGAIALFGNTDITGTLDVTSTTTTPSIITNNITGSTTTDPLYISNSSTQLGRIYIGGAKASSSGGIYIGGSNNPVSVYGTSTFVLGLESQNTITLTNSSYIIPPTVPPTLPITALAYYYNYPVLATTNTSTGYDFNPASNTSGGSNFFNAGVYVANINSISRFTAAVTSGNYTYNIGVSYTTSTGTVTTGNSTVITPVSGSMRGFYFGNIVNVDFSNSHTICFTIASNSFVNLFSNISSLTLTGGNVTISTYGCVRRIA